MPAAIKYIDDPNSKDAQMLDGAYSREIQARKRVYKCNWDYYYGDHKKHLLPDGTNTEDNVTINLVELLIDKGVSSLMGTTDQGAIKGPDFEVVAPMMQQGAAPAQRQPMIMGEGTSDDSPADEWLDKVWEVNSKSIFLHDLALNGGVCGHLFVKIIPDALQDPDAPGLMLPRLIVLNPANVTPFWDVGDVARVLWYRIQYGEGTEHSTSSQGPTKREDIIREIGDNGLDTGRWIVRTFVRRNEARWAQQGDDVIWEHSWPPIIDWKNLPRPNEYFGLNDLRGNGNINDGLNFTASNMQRIIKHHAKPKTIATGVSESEPIESSVDTLYTITSKDARVYNLEMQSDLSSSLNYMNFLRRAFFDSGRELDPATVQDKLGAITNFGLRVLFRDSLEKTGTKRLLYGAGLRLLSRRLLELGGFGPNNKVVDKWPDSLPVDPLQTAQALVLDRQNGLSQTTYLERRGFDASEETQRREAELAENVLANTLTSQGSLLQRFRSVSNGTTNGQPATGTPNGATVGRAA